MPTTLITPSGATNLLGCLYNVLTQPYAEKSSITQNCVVSGIKDAKSTQTVTIDSTNNIAYVFPSSLSVIAANEVQASTFLGESVDEISTSLSVRAGISGSYGEFSASVTSMFNTSTYEYNSYYYCVLFDAKTVCYASFTQDQIGNALTLSSAFSKDLNGDTYTPENFFNTYGTHIISGIRIGGEVRFSCYADKSIYETQESFSVDAKAKYSSLSASTTVTVDTTQISSSYSENIQYSSSLLVYGGSAAGQAEVKPNGDFSVWLESVIGNPEFMEFSENNGLIPVWNLCTNAARKTALQNYFENYYATTLAVDISTEKLTSADATKLNSDASTALNAYAKNYGYAKVWQTTKDTQVITGFGARIDDNTHLTRMLIATVDLATGETEYHATGDGTTDTEDYEMYYAVPNGYAMTGLGLREHDNNLSNMVVYCQAIDQNASSSGYLDPDRQTAWKGGALSSYEASYIPDEYGNKYVITGIMVDCSSKQGGFDQLVLKIAKLMTTTN